MSKTKNYTSHCKHTDKDYVSFHEERERETKFLTFLNFSTHKKILHVRDNKDNFSIKAENKENNKKQIIKLEFLFINKIIFPKKEFWF